LPHQRRAEHTEPLGDPGFSSSISSGIIVQMAMPMNDRPSTQRTGETVRSHGLAPLAEQETVDPPA